MVYRKEIDGLRAIAVLAVIFFHAGFSFFSGGFVGVDVFFVISGYLITSIIISDLSNAKFSLIAFYERRFRRIFPALFLVLMVCLPFAWYLMPPKQLDDFSQTLVAVCLFISNILFWRQTNYFNSTDGNPLLHTWSLSVEEQFYLLFPLLLLFLWRFNKRILLGLLFCCAAISLLVAHWGAILKPTPTFFLLPTRAWELLIGALVAFFMMRQQHKPAYSLIVCQCFSLLGFFLVLTSVFGFDKNTPFPSFYALVPTLGSALIILFARQDTVVGRLLSQPIFVGIGLISYSLYLWHQPIFAFARLGSLNEPSLSVCVLLILASVFLAYLSWRFVEKPFRDKSKVSRKSIFVSALMFSAGFIYLGIWGTYAKGFPQRIPKDVLATISPEKTDMDLVCKWLPINSENSRLNFCEFGDVHSKRAIFLYGDSHAHAIFTALNESFKARGIKGLKINITPGCNAIPSLIQEAKKSRPDVLGLKKCLDEHDQILGFIRENAQGVVIAMRWTLKLYDLQGLVDGYGFDNGEGGVEHISASGSLAYIDGVFKADPASKKKAVQRFIADFIGLDKKVYLFYPFPEVGWHVPDYAFKAWRLNNDIEATISTNYATYKTRNTYIHLILDGIDDTGHIVRIKPDSIFCNTFIADRCVAQYQGKSFYYDTNHPSNAGSRLVVNEMMKFIE